MTKYVLNSGGLKNEPQKAQLFMKEVLRGLGSPVSVLLCFFAEPDTATWANRFATMSQLLQEWSPTGVLLKCSLAYSTDTFAADVASNQVIYLHGGISAHAVKMFRSFDLQQLFSGKVVASNSATTHMLSQAYWSVDERCTGLGLGIVPVRTIAHYDSAYSADSPDGRVDWTQAKQDLEVFGDRSLPLHALKEGEFIVRTQKD